MPEPIENNEPSNATMNNETQPDFFMEFMMHEEIMQIMKGEMDEIINTDAMFEI